MVVYVFAEDFSGSTGGSSRGYHQKCRETFGKFIEDRNSRGDEVKATYLCLWDTKCEEVDDKKLEKVWKSQEGRGGTQPSCFCLWYVEKMDKANLKDEKVNLWLVTDGQISKSAINEARSVNEKIPFENVKFFIFQTNYYMSNDADISVGLCFVKETATLQVYVDEYKKPVNANLNFDYDSIKTHEDLTEERRQELYAFGGLVGMVRAPEEVLKVTDEIKKLRDRVLASIKEGNNKENLQTLTFEQVPTTTSALLDLIRNSSFYKYQTTQVDEVTLKKELDAFFTRLLENIHNSQQRMNYGFSKIKYNRQIDKLAAQKKAKELDEEDVPDTHEYFEPITLQEEGNSAMLLLKPYDLIEEVWKKGSQSKYKALLDCPFLACNRYVDSSIDHVISVETYNEFLVRAPEVADGKAKMIESPITRAAVYGGIVPYNLERGKKNNKNNKFKHIDDWNDYMVSLAFFQGKRATNLFPLWYYVLYVCVKNKSWVPDSVKEDLRDYALLRMKKIRIPLTMCTLPSEPKIRVPTPLALRYCLDLSSYLFAENPQLFSMERLRKFAGLPSEIMMEIVRHYGHTFEDENFVSNRCALWNEWNRMRKMQGGKFERLRYVMEQIFETRSIGEIAFLVANADDSAAIETDNAKYVLVFANWLRWIKTPVPLSLELKTSEEIMALVQPLLYTSYRHQFSDDIPLCHKTWRPYFQVKESPSSLPNANFYQELIGSVKDWTVDVNIQPTAPESVSRLDFQKIISLYKAYIDFVHKHKRYPNNVEEYAAFIYKRYSRVYEDKEPKTEQGDGDGDGDDKKKSSRHKRKMMRIRVFPSNIVEAINRAFEAYDETAKKNEKVEDFIRITTESADRSRRLAMEKEARSQDSVFTASLLEGIDEQFLTVDRQRARELNKSQGKRKKHAREYWKKKAAAAKADAKKPDDKGTPLKRSVKPKPATRRGRPVRSVRR